MTIETTIFPEPSGEVRGFVIAHMNFGKRDVRVGHALLLVGKDPQISLKAPMSVPLDLIPAFVAKITEFHAAVVKAQLA